MPAVSPGTTTGNENFLSFKSGFLRIIDSFHIARKSGFPAVGAYPTSSEEVKSGTYFFIEGSIIGLPSTTVVPIVPFAVFPSFLASALCAIIPFGK